MIAKRSQLKRIGPYKGRIFRCLGFYSDSKFSPSQRNAITEIFNDAVSQVEDPSDDDEDDSIVDINSEKPDAEFQPYYEAMTQAEGNEGIKLLNKKIQEIEKSVRRMKIKLMRIGPGY